MSVAATLKVSAKSNPNAVAGALAAALRERGGLPDPEQAYLTGNVDDIDDFSACKITRKEDWVDLYAKPYYFGCEADDRMNATAGSRPGCTPMRPSGSAITCSDRSVVISLV